MSFFPMTKWIATKTSGDLTAQFISMYIFPQMQRTFQTNHRENDYQTGPATLYDPAIVSVQDSIVTADED
jgi:hypothetical protein